MADNPTPSTNLMAERYGRGSTAHRPIVAVVVAFVALATVVVWLMAQSANDPVRAGLLSWDVPADGVLPVTVEIRRDADTAVTCELVAVDIRQIVVGQLTLNVPAGPDEHFTVDAEIPLEGDGIAPELRECQPAS